MPSRTFATSVAVIALSVSSFAACMQVGAASPDDWQAFRKDVEGSCLSAAKALIRQPQIVVDPFGSQSYGLAFLTGIETEGGGPRSLVCIYDKAAKKAEIGGTMALETAVPALQPESAASVEPRAPAPVAVAVAGPQTTSTVPPADDTAAAVALSERFLSPSAAAAMPVEASALMAPAPAAAPFPMPPASGTTTEMASIAAPAPGAPSAGAGFAGQCDARCATTLSALGAADRTALEELAAEVTRTIGRNAAASLAAGPAKAREAALAVAASAQGEAAGTVAPPAANLIGETSCVLYYYGYSGQASRTVGRHRCAVTAGEGGSLVVEKTSGERLHAEIRPLTGEVSAFVGRTYKQGQADDRYDPLEPVSGADKALGNTVGFAASDAGRLVLVSSQLPRFEDKGDFFWVLALDPK